MQTKHLCVFIYIWTKGKVGAPLNRFKPSSKIFYWPFQGSTSFVNLVCFFCLVFAMPLYASVYMYLVVTCCGHLSVYMCLVVTCWERADLLALVCGVLLWVCYFPIGILGQVRYLIVSIPDFCTLTYLVEAPDQLHCSAITNCWIDNSNTDDHICLSEIHGTTEIAVLLVFLILSF